MVPFVSIPQSYSLGSNGRVIWLFFLATRCLSRGNLCEERTSESEGMKGELQVVLAQIVRQQQSASQVK